jgi:hypothetical protein
MEQISLTPPPLQGLGSLVYSAQCLPRLHETSNSIPVPRSITQTEYCIIFFQPNLQSQLYRSARPVAVTLLSAQIIFMALAAISDCVFQNTLQLALQLKSFSSCVWV